MIWIGIGIAIAGWCIGSGIESGLKALGSHIRHKDEK